MNWFNNYLSAHSPNGSVDKEIFKIWYREIVCILYPDIENVMGKNVLVKSDGGPGRTNVDYLSESFLDGLVHYPCLPNGTLFQELDNIFFDTKTGMDANRKMIFDKSYELYGEKANVTSKDIPYILFGGERSFPDGSVLFLENIYARSLNAKRLYSAQKKCGYVPAKRTALESGKLRHDIVLDENGDLTEESNDMSMAKALLQVEQENHSVVDRLQGKGYQFAHLLKRELKKIEEAASQTFAQTVTVPGTTEHQRRLMKASTQGKHFYVTNGGAPMNSEDCLIAHEMKCYEEEKVNLTRKKKAASAFRKIRDAAEGVVGQDYKNWSVVQLKAKIRLADANVKATAFTGLKKPGIQKLWKNKYSKVKPNHDEQRWTVRNEKRFRHILTGNVGALDKTGIYTRAVKGRFDWMNIKLDHIPKREALALSLKVLQKYCDTSNGAEEFIAQEFEKDVWDFVLEGYDDSESSDSDDDESHFSVDSDDDKKTGTVRGRNTDNDDSSSSDEDRSQDLSLRDVDDNNEGCRNQEELLSEEELSFDSRNLPSDEEDENNQDDDSASSTTSPSQEDQGMSDNNSSARPVQEDQEMRTSNDDIQIEIPGHKIVDFGRNDAEVGSENASEKDAGTDVEDHHFDEDVVNDDTGAGHYQNNDEEHDVHGNEGAEEQDWENMNKQSLIAKCKEYGIQGDNRHSVATLISNLKEWKVHAKG